MTCLEVGIMDLLAARGQKLTQLTAEVRSDQIRSDGSCVHHVCVSWSISAPVFSLRQLNMCVSSSCSLTVTVLLLETAPSSLWRDDCDCSWNINGAKTISWKRLEPVEWCFRSAVTLRGSCVCVTTTKRFCKQHNVHIISTVPQQESSRRRWPSCQQQSETSGHCPAVCGDRNWCFKTGRDDLCVWT